MAEGAQVFFSQHSLHRHKYIGDFLATPEHFFIAEAIRIFRFAYSRDRQFAAPEPPDVLRVLFGPHELVMTAPHEVEQVIEKLADFGRSDEVVQVQLRKALAQINP